MKLTFIRKERLYCLKKPIQFLCLFYLLFICWIPVKAYGQDMKFSIHTTHARISEVFALMKAQQPELDLFYNNNEFDVEQKVDVNVDHASLDELMKILLTNRYTYQLIDKHLVIKLINTNTLSSGVQRQQVVSGQVTDKKGAAIPGVVVKANLAKSNSITDSQGRYTIHVHANDILTFSYIGYEKQEIAVKNNSQIDLVLKEDVAFLNEVVVTGYQTLTRKNAPGAFAVITEEDITKHNNISLNRLLEGTLPGLTIYKNAEGADDIRIRGGSSLLTNTNPLFVVDGFVTTIMPDINEIQSITALKDASAAAIWGSQAANGVIVITTKKGKPGKLKITYAGNARITGRPDYNQLRRADAPAIIDYQKEEYDKGYIMAPIFDGSKEGYAPSIAAIIDYDRGDISLAERDKRLAGLSASSNKAQINNLLLRQAVNQSHFISFSGGSEKADYFLSANYQANTAGIVGQSSKVTTINSRNSYQIAPFLRLRTDLSAAYTSATNGYTDMSSYIRNLLPYQQLLDAQGNYVYDYRNFNPIENTRLKQEGYMESGFNVLEESRNANNKTSGWGLKTRAGADWKLMEGLSFSNDFLYERTISDNNNLMNQNGYDVRTLVNRLTSLDDKGKLVFNVPKGDILDAANTQYNNYAFRNQLNYNRTFNKKHYVNVIAGFDLRKEVNKNSSSRKLGYNDDLLSFQSIDAKMLASTGITWWDGTRQNYNESSYTGLSFNDTREYSYYTSAVYTYDERYTLSGSYRVDQSNLFGADPKFKHTPLWSVGGSWNISNEAFFKSEAISNLGLRATYGLTGNFDRKNGTTTFLTAYRFFNTIANDYVARLQTPPNPKLRWERSNTFNLGLDMGLFKGRYSASLEFYRKNSYDLLGDQELDPTVGQTKATINAASLLNKGVELALKAGILATHDFNWTSNLNLAYNTSKVSKNNLVDGDPVINRVTGTSQYIEGYARESVWSYKWAGLDNAGRPMVYNAAGDKVYTPDLGSLEYSGSARPKLSGGWRNTFGYKNFELSTMLVFNLGQVARREMPDLNGFDWSGSYNDQIAQRWRKPGDELHTDIPAIPDFENLGDTYTRMAKYSNNSIIDASFVRLREIQLAYRLNKNVLRHTPFSNVRFVAQVNNVYLYKWNKDGIDPEAIANGVYMLPEPFTTTLGITLDF